MMRCSNCKKHVAEWDAFVCLDCEQFFCQRCRDEHYEAMNVAEEETHLHSDPYDSIHDNTDTDLTKSLNS